MKKIFFLFLLLFFISRIQAQNIIPDSIVKVYDSVAIKPTYKPGALRYLSANIKFPLIARESGFEGKVVVKFYVDIDGSLKDPVIIRNDGCIECANEVLKVIKSFPPWTPGYNDGFPVRTYFTLPVTFSSSSGGNVNDRPAIFKGGNDMLESYINSTGINIKTTTKLIYKKNTKCTTIVKFKILEDGTTVNPAIISSNLNDDTAIEKIKVAVTKMLWFPALENGKTVSSIQEITFTF